MKRRGYILLEALIALFLIALLSAVLYPFAAEAVRAVDLMAKRSRIAGEGLYAMDFMTEQLRNALKRGRRLRFPAIPTATRRITSRAK